MTEFKQIIGRGTRIDESYDKLWFTIIDFKKATELFADPEFDGDPVQVYTPNLQQGEGIVPGEEPPESPPQSHGGVAEESPVFETGTGDGVNKNTEGEPRKKYVVGNVAFNVIDQRVQYLDASGKLITEDLTDYTRSKVQAKFATLKDFLRHWKAAERKQAIIDELAELGIFWEDLIADLGKKLGDEPDPFDVITHIVYGQPALTRRQRAAKTKGRSYFAKYQDTARQVLDALVDKYADTGVAAIEDIKVLKLPPFDQIGTIKELVDAFGNKAQFEKARLELENTLYELDAG